MNFFSKFFSFKKNKYVLVISGGGVRWFYALGILKAMEEFGLRDKIDAIYGVSAGAIIWSYRAAGYTAQEIFDRLIATKVFSLKTFNFKLGKSLLSHDFLKDRFVEDLPQTFTWLKKKLFIGAVDARKAKFHLFEEGNLITPLLASMSIPGVFPPVEYKDFCLVDGGMLNNFPADLAKEHYPHHKIIWIYLNQFLEDQKIDNIFEGLSLTYEILLRWPSLPKLDIPDYLFYKGLDIPILSIDIKKMKQIFLMWYADGLKTFATKQQ